ncbi:MAG: hypothetical protein AMJ65_08160 [Phycisphaerae bacterium SG8_4]|nr:MAG: hypothetical protein AMJ65_08160 [Phycisphaerae bacterium SG8_4]
MPPENKMLVWIRSLWPLVVALVAAVMLFTKVQDDQQDLQQALTKHLARSIETDKELADCKIAIRTVQTDLRWIREGVAANAQTLEDIRLELRK